MFHSFLSRCIMGCKKGFTLIELLIVVAIIAILAAIAVPNFLEAQVRAKVSRVRADVRSTATALESYKIDTNKYPPQAEFPYRGAIPGSGLDNNHFHSRIPSWLSTPIAYMSSIPDDIFVPPGHWAGYPPSYYRYIYFNYDEWIEGSPASTTYKGRKEQTGTWLFYSFGPDKNDNQAAGAQPGLQGTYTRYDPTNGTTSRGNIIRTAASPEGFIPYNAGVTGSQNGPN